MDGILLIDKPIGPSSFDVVRSVRRLCGVKKVGHAGTLDPLASGLLVVCLGRYTKLAGYLTNHDKIYQATVHLGIQTTTDDGEGEIVATKSLDGLDLSNIERALQSFIGPLKQTPPQFSAIKIQGKRAYALAREKKVVELGVREVTVHDLVLETMALPELKLTIHCSKGFYIRSLARDIGERVGVGAYASHIRRIKSGSFSISQAIALDKLSQENINARLLVGCETLSDMEIMPISVAHRNDLICGRLVDFPLIKNEIAIASFEGMPVAILGKALGKTCSLRVL